MFGPLKKHPRLGQWNGRTRSSRGDEPILPKLWSRRVLLRLAVVWLTTLVVTVLAYCSGPPFPYRVGVSYPFDQRVRVDFDVVNQVEQLNRKEALRTLGAAGPKGQTPEDKAVLAEKMPVLAGRAVDHYQRGTLLIQRGHPITERQLSLLH